MLSLSNVFLGSLLLGKVFSLPSGGGWVDGTTATGTTDPEVTDGCDFWANDVKSNDTCSALESYFDITMKQLKAWNPAIDPSYCVLATGFSYCVSGPSVSAMTSSSITPSAVRTVAYSGTPGPVQSGLAPSCTKYYMVQNGDTCYSIQDQFMDFTLSQFYAWNPSIRSGCNGLVDGDYVCVAAKSSSTSATATASSSSFPTQTGVSSKCDKWHFVNGTDTCDSIRDEYDLTPAQFYKYNPATGSQCTNLWRQVYVCVGISDSSSAANSTATATAAPSATTSGSGASVPSPVQTGITSGCNEYYLVKKDDSCYNIEQDRNITKADFNKWNPAVGSDCADLLTGFYVCVGV